MFVVSVAMIAIVLIIVFCFIMIVIVVAVIVSDHQQRINAFGLVNDRHVVIGGF